MDLADARPPADRRPRLLARLPREGRECRPGRVARARQDHAHQEPAPPGDPRWPFRALHHGRRSDPRSNGQDTSRALERRLRTYARPQILAIDEIGYLSYDAHAADLLFQVVSRRYEQSSIVITTNLPFKQWDTVFPNASCAVALIDRLTHHAEIIPIEGETYRKREAELTQKKRRAVR